MRHCNQLDDNFSSCWMMGGHWAEKNKA